MNLDDSAETKSPESKSPTLWQTITSLKEQTHRLEIFLDNYLGFDVAEEMSKETLFLQKLRMVPLPSQNLQPALDRAMFHYREMKTRYEQIVSSINKVPSASSDQHNKEAVVVVTEQVAGAQTPLFAATFAETQKTIVDAHVVIIQYPTKGSLQEQFILQSSDLSTIVATVTVYSAGDADVYTFDITKRFLQQELSDTTLRAILTQAPLLIVDIITAQFKRKDTACEELMKLTGNAVKAKSDSLSTSSTLQCRLEQVTANIKQVFDFCVIDNTLVWTITDMLFGKPVEFQIPLLYSMDKSMEHYGINIFDKYESTAQLLDTWMTFASFFTRMVHRLEQDGSAIQRLKVLEAQVVEKDKQLAAQTTVIEQLQRKALADFT
jgi:hypothetical protein